MGNLQSLPARAIEALGFDARCLALARIGACGYGSVAFRDAGDTFLSGLLHLSSLSKPKPIVTIKKESL